VDLESSDARIPKIEGTNNGVLTFTRHESSDETTAAFSNRPPQTHGKYATWSMRPMLEKKE
jgi:hypothetical protein